MFLILFQVNERNTVSYDIKNKCQNKKNISKIQKKTQKKIVLVVSRATQSGDDVETSLTRMAIISWLIESHAMLRCYQGSS
mgnify:CR=1 FL=1